MRKWLMISTAVLVVSGCGQVHDSAFFNPGDPERLLDVSSETIRVPLSSQRSISELMRWLNQEQPARAEISCAGADMVCSKARTVLRQNNVALTEVHAATEGNGVNLVYERTVARDCKSRYVDRAYNPHLLAQPSLGCSVTANTVQMVSDKQQFTNPALLDFPDGEKSVQVYRAYSAKAKEGGVSDSLLSSMGGGK